MSRNQLGSTNWAFIITLLLLLVFIWMWFDETDKQDKMTKELQESKQKVKDLNAEGLVIADMLQKVTKVVGWPEKTYSFQHIQAPQGSFPVSDWDKISSHANPEGTVAGGDGNPQDGLLKQILGEFVLIYDREARLHSTKTGEETTHTFSTLSAEFKERLTDVRNRLDEIVANRPVPPADPDDKAGESDYKTAMADYERKVTEYHNALKELMQTEGWVEYQTRIKAPGTWGDPTTEGQKVSFMKYTDTGERTLQAAIEGIPGAIRLMKQEIAAYISAANEQITQLRGDTKAKEDAVTQLRGELEKEQTGRTNDVAQLQGQLAEANERGNRNSVEKTNIEQQFAKFKDDASKESASLKREIEARKEQNRLLKEKRDLLIARDDPDGAVLAVNHSLRTGSIDLGHSDKAYVGQKFVASSLDRAGNRVNRGELMITRVTGRHSSQVRLISGTVTAGDRIHNPFYERGERVYVYFAGKLDKWPLEMAKQRLAPLNVIVQDEMDGNTHYAVVPNSWAVVAKPTGGEDEEEDDGEEEGGAAGTSPLEEVQKRARVVGANVITENLLDAFLDY